MRISTFFLLLFLCAALPHRLSAQYYDYDELTPVVNHLTWRVSSGYSFIQTRISFETGTRLSSLDISPGLSSVRANVGSRSSFADREYDNGFVRKDFGTPVWGNTWYWGYEDSGQVQGNSLVFRAFDGVVRTPSDTDGSAVSRWKDDFNDNTGISIQLDMILPPAERLNCGISFCLTQSSFSSFRTTKQDVSSYSRRFIEDTYDLGGVAPPSAPYSGSLAGPGPSINNIPSSRRVVFSQVSGIRSEITESLDVRLSTFSIGAFVEYHPGFLYMSAASGPSISFVDMKAGLSETLYVTQGSRVLSATWNEMKSDDVFQPGLFAQADLGIEISERIRLGIFSRYDWVDTVSGDIGPSRYKAKFSTVSYGAKASWQL